MPHSLPVESSSLHHHCQVTEAAVLHLHLILVMNTGGEKQRNNIILFLARSLDGKKWIYTNLLAANVSHHCEN